MQGTCLAHGDKLFHSLLGDRRSVGGRGGDAVWSVYSGELITLGTVSGDLVQW